MRTLLAIALIIVPTAAFAYCPVLADANSAAQTNLTQQQLIACQQAELDTTVKLKQQRLDFDAALQAQQQTFNTQLRLQQTFDAAQAVATPKF